MRPAPDKLEQTDEERMEIARRYRESRGLELRSVAATALDAEVIAAGEFDTVPTEAIASVPIVGAFLAVFMRLRYARRKLPPKVMLALDAEQAHMLATDSTVGGETKARVLHSWPRSAVRVSAINRRFMRDEVTFEISDRDPIKLFAPRLKLNPWTAEVVRLLGGDAPEPIDLNS